MATHSSILPWRNPLDREAWRATVQGVTKSQTQLSTQYTHTHTHTHTHRNNLLYVNYTSIQLFLKRQSYTSPPVHSTKIQTYSGLRLIKLIDKSGKNSDCIICLSSVQSLSHIQLFAIPWTHARPPCPSPTPRVYSNSCHLPQEGVKNTHGLKSYVSPFHLRIFLSWIMSSLQSFKNA